LVDLAQRGKRVCRLKGGDPFIFGRGGEELEALARAGIRFEVVPGITAAAGCAAYAGIPLTHRDYAQSVTFATGHCKGDDDNIDWEMLARPNQTVVFYMGLRALDNIIERLQTHGVPGTRAVAVIEQGTQSSQRVITATLTTLRARVLEAKVQSPALLIVGEVTRLHAVLDWFNTSSHSYAQADTSTDDSRFLSGRFTSGRLTA
jgi:uroporphyrin-III C-methyltransferase